MTDSMCLLRLIGEVDDAHLRVAEGACPAAVRTHPVWIKWAAIAACLAVLLAGCVGVMSLYLPPKTPPEPVEGFVMYEPGALTWIEFEERIYSFYETVPASTRLMTVGNKLGEGVCASSDEMSASVMMYAVKGIDPSFMITSVYGNVYICDNDITLAKGADIFETRLRLKERYTAVKQSAWVDGELEKVTLEEQYHDEFESFLEALCEGDCVPLADVKNKRDEKGRRIDTLHMLQISMDNGLLIILSLYDGGYVEFHGLDVAVKMEEEAFGSWCKLLDELEGSP